MLKTIKVRAWGRMEDAYYYDCQAWVWDSVAGHYTTCHSLTKGQIERVRRLART
jgi:hypothetical protein